MHKIQRISTHQTPLDPPCVPTAAPLPHNKNVSIPFQQAIPLPSAQPCALRPPSLLSSRQNKKRRHPRQAISIPSVRPCALPLRPALLPPKQKSAGIPSRQHRRPPASCPITSHSASPPKQKSLPGNSRQTHDSYSLFNAISLRPRRPSISAPTAA